MPLLLLIILGIDWASGYAIAGYCMTHGVQPYGYAFWQSFGPFVLLLAIQCLRRDLWLGPQGAVYVVLCGIFGIVIPNLLIYMVARYLPSGLLTVLANTSPIFTYIFALLLGDERFKWQRLLFVVAGLCGVGLILFSSYAGLSGYSGLFAHSGLSVRFKFGGLWLALALLIPLSYAFSAVYISRFHPGRGSVLVYALWMLMIATLCTSPLAVIEGGYYSLRWGDLNSNLIVLEILLSALGYILLFIILRMVGAVYYSLVNAIAAVTGIIYGHFIFAQAFSRSGYVALLIIGGAIVGLTYTQQRRSQRPARTGSSGGPGIYGRASLDKPQH